MSTPAEAGAKKPRARKVGRRINRLLPVDVHKMATEMAVELYGGDLGPVLCNAIRREYQAHAESKAKKGGSGGE